MPDPSLTGAPQSSQSEQAAVLERVKKAELEAKAQLEEAAAQAEKIRAEAKAEAGRIVADAEAEASRKASEIVRAGRIETEKELEAIRKEASESADKFSRQKQKKFGTREILESVLSL